MEIENTSPAPSKWNTVTPFSKYAALLIFITLPFVAFWVGMNYGPEKIIIQKEIVRIPIETLLTEEQKAEMSNEKLDVKEGYLKSRYKVVAIVDSPFERNGTTPESDKITGSKLYVVTTRGINDYTCGGKYTPSECYFFLEASYADIPDITYIGSWGGTAIDPKQIRFTKNDVVEFASGDGDAGLSIEQVWDLDLKTGSTTRISSKETDSNP